MITVAEATKIDVLDHGFVRLVDFMGEDIAIVRSARVSYDAAWRAGEDAGSDAKLIRYLWKHQHTTPFESVVFQFEVKAPIFVLRQWVRHRTFSLNELSARYRELPEDFYVPAPDQVGAQSPDTKQARIAAPPDVESSALIRAACESAFSTYRELLQRGVPRELRALGAARQHVFHDVREDNPTEFVPFPKSARRRARATQNPRLRRSNAEHQPHRPRREGGLEKQQRGVFMTT